MGGKITVWALFDSGNGCYSKGMEELKKEKGIEVEIFSVGIDIENKNKHNFINLNLADNSQFFGENKIFNDEISERAKEIFSYIAPSYKIELVEWNHDKDHVHILFKGQPKTEMSKFINAYKSASSRLLKKEFPIIRQKLWKEMFWSQSFCLLSSGGAPIEVIKEYIENQGQKK